MRPAERARRGRRAAGGRTRPLPAASPRAPETRRRVWLGRRPERGMVRSQVRLPASGDGRMSEMYRPAANAVGEEAGWELLAGIRAGHLVTAEAGALDATFLPFLVDVDSRRIVAHV